MKPFLSVGVNDGIYSLSLKDTDLLEIDNMLIML